ncbi:MAG: N-acetyltransferase [Alphaproteobacteria bacterium]|nr:N-acetyltransferase [Alphaproteobacteria bacterium]
MPLKIRKATEADIADILNIHTKAFGADKGPEIADLVSGLLSDQSAMPLLSLVATEEDQMIGHILYTKARIIQSEENVSANILAPLAVLPEAQSKGVGGKLIKQGLELLKESGIDLVFVLGHPDYYPRYGFKPAGELGYEAPYPIPEKYAGAWMVQELRPDIIGKISGKVQCCKAMDQPQYWRE